jgi:N-acetylmuramoyl-L-alanine amidase
LKPAAMRLRIAPILFAVALGACAPLPSKPSYVVGTGAWTPSPNFDERRPSLVILHHTSSSDAGRALRTLTDPERRVSSHYLITRDGLVLQLVDERARAWHAGVSYWGGTRDLNSASIGIELDNNGEEPFAEPLIEALLVLLAELRERYRIAPEGFLGHADVAPGRKVDPSRYFPWERLARHGFGLWCDPPYPTPPPALDEALLLQALGYDVSRVQAAVGAFKLRYAPEDPEPQMTERTRSIAYCLALMRQRRGAEPPDDGYADNRALRNHPGAAGSAP